uniref:Uncharacterized protein n=1 Tax=Timema bartmani TaxID=61472 RepID=A0A7R9F115_9NEOP|nr:unnamed protein product [Timema bartmani]
MPKAVFFSVNIVPLLNEVVGPCRVMSLHPIWVICPYKGATSGLGIYPECSPCGWEVSGWRLRSDEYVTSEPTLIIRENELDGCRYDVLQVDNGNENHPTDIQGKLTSHRGDGGDSWQIKAMSDQRIKLVFGNSANRDTAALGYPRNPGYRVELKPSPLREFDDIQLPSEAVVSNGYQMQVDLQKFDVYKEFSATYSFESKQQLTLSTESGTIRGPVFVPMSERLCVAILFRAAPFPKPIRYSNPRSRLAESREDYDYTPSEDTRLTVTLQLLDGTEINVGTVEAPEVGHILLQKMIHVGTVEAQEVGHILLEKMEIHVGTAKTPEVCHILLEGTEIHVRTVEAQEVGHILLTKMEIHVGTMEAPEVDKWIYQRFVIELQPDHQQREMAYVITAGQKIGAKLFVRKVEECDPEGNNGKCINGGVLSKDSNECICPPGFRGFFCEDGCGVNKYGDDCGGKCSSFRRGCKGLVMCKEKIGCDCAPGFQGQLCDTPCDPGHYGFGCKQTCGHCAGNLCDSFSGSCFSGCVNGYFAPLCFYTVLSQSLPRPFYPNSRGAVVGRSSVVPKLSTTAASCKEGGDSRDIMALETRLPCEQGNFELTMLIKYKYLSTAPIAEPVSADTIQVYFSVDHTQGRGSPRFYKLQHKKNGEAAWIDHYPKTLPRDYVTTNITGLETWTWYDIRVILIDLNLNSYEGYDIPSATARTKCILPSNVDYHLQSPSASENSFQVLWRYDQQVRWCPLTNYEVYLRDGWRWVLSKRTHESTANFSDVLPGREHKVKLRAMTVNGPATFSKTLSIVTSDQVPEAVLDVYQDSVQRDRIRIVWREPRFTAGNIRHYVVTYKCQSLVACPSEDCSYSAGELEIETNYVELKGLLPHAQYIVSVSAVSGFKGPTSTIHAATDHTGIGKVEVRGSEPAFAWRESGTSISPSSVVWLNTTGALANYGHRGGFMSVVPPDPSLTPVTNRTSTSFVVHWNHLQNCTGINGFLNHYHYEMESDTLASDYDQVEEESNENLYSVESLLNETSSILSETDISDEENYYESNASDKKTNEFENSSGEELNQSSDEKISGAKSLVGRLPRRRGGGCPPPLGLLPIWEPLDPERGGTPSGAGYRERNIPGAYQLVG